MTDRMIDPIVGQMMKYNRSLLSVRYDPAMGEVVIVKWVVPLNDDTKEFSTRLGLIDSGARGRCECAFTTEHSMLPFKNAASVTQTIGKCRLHAGLKTYLAYGDQRIAERRLPNPGPQFPITPGRML
jgi:hypothetical protein